MYVGNVAHDCLEICMSFRLGVELNSVVACSQTEDEAAFNSSILVRQLLLELSQARINYLKLLRQNLRLQYLCHQLIIKKHFRGLL